MGDDGDLERGAFVGVRVLDCSDGFAGALCTMILGDNGAAVVRPEIDHGGAWCAEDDRDEPPGARQWRRSTTVVRFDAASFATEVGRLVDEADVVVCSAGSRAARALGIGGDRTGAAALRDARPALVVCVIDAFGEHPVLGLVPLHDGVVHAASGRMVDNGASFRLGRPAYVSAPLPGFGAAQAAVQGIVAALVDRARTGAGQVVRTSLVRGQTIFDFWGPDGPSAGGRPVGALGPTPAPGYTPAPTKDGKWLQWANFAPHLLRQMLQLLGLDELLADPRFANPSALAPAEAHELWERILVATEQRTADEWMALLAETGAAGGDLVRSTVEGMDHPQVRYNGDVVTVDDPDLGVVEQLGPVAQLGAAEAPRGPRSWAGARAHTPAFPAAAPGAAPNAVARPPLDGVVLLEAASMIATPIGSCLLADLGARVIKIEPIGGELGRSLPFIKTLLGKESIAVDIKTAAGREIVHRLAARADMFLHNYRPGVPERLGIDDASLRAHNAGLVYLYVGGYGKHGPCEKMPAYHPVAGAVCGNAARQAGEGARWPVPVDMAARKAASLHLGVANEGHPDPVTGALAASVLLLGLADRERRGEGTEMWTSMLCASAHLYSGEWIRHAARPATREVDHALHGTGALDRLYETRDGWLFVGVDDSASFARLAEVLAAHVPAAGALAGERYSTVASRRSNDAALVELLSSAFAERTADEWEVDLLAVGVGAVRADRGSFAAFQQAEVAAGRLDLARRVATPGRGEHWRSSSVLDMRGVDELTGACLAGQHTRPILRELGYTDAEIDTLAADGVVGLAPGT